LEDRPSLGAIQFLSPRIPQFPLEKRREERSENNTAFGKKMAEKDKDGLQQHSVREPGGKFGESHHRRVKEGPEGTQGATGDSGKKERTMVMQKKKKGENGESVGAKETKLEELEQSFAASISRNLVRAVGFYFKNPVKLFRPAVIEVM
jgi:hypothetical protein